MNPTPSPSPEKGRGTISRIEGWQFVTFPGADGVVEGKLNLVGEIYNHEGIVDGSYRMTSRVQVINKPGELVQTRSGTVYSLGEPRKEWMKSMGYETKEAAIWGMVGHALEVRLIPPAPFEKGGE
jgi:hypothetical protein